MPATFRTASAIQKGHAAFPTSSVHVSFIFIPTLCCCGILSFIVGFFAAIAYLLWFESGDEL
jgi:hypothetical protein